MRCISIVLLVLTSTAHAENWHPIANLDSNGSVLLFDVAGVTEVKGLRRAWFKSVYRSDQLIPNEYLILSIGKDPEVFQLRGPNQCRHAVLLEWRR